MEDNNYSPESNFVVRTAAKFIAELRIVGEQLLTADLNPHEGRLRASAAPKVYMEIPDYPPMHDATI